MAMPASAKPPDHAASSSEAVCDGYNGVAGGLCNAYCGAMACASDEPGASDRACERKRELFVEATGDAPPCEQQQSACPCAEIQGFNDFLMGDLDVTSCFMPDPGQRRAFSDWGGTDWATFFVMSNPFGGTVCGYFDSFSGVQTLPISGDEVDQCIDVIDEVAARDGQVCEDSSHN